MNDINEIARCLVACTSKETVCGIVTDLNAYVEQHTTTEPQAGLALQLLNAISVEHR